MNKCKKALSLLLALLMVMSLMPFATVSAADEATIVASTVEQANAGDEIEVLVQLLNNPGVISAKVKLEWNADVMELVTEWVYDEDLDEDVESNKIEVAKGWSSKWLSFGPPGKCIVNFAYGTATKDVTKEDFFTATFRIKDDAISGTYPITVVYDPADFFNVNGEDVAFGKQDTTITVNGRDPEPPACEHAYDNACDADCNLCGELREVADHDYQVSDTLDPTCGAEGKTVYTCSACGASYDESIPATGQHEYDNDCDAACNVCSAVRPISHAWSDATCTEPSACSKCGATNGEALGHDYADATCTDAKTCKVCGTTEGEAAGHKSDKGTVTKKATCKATGVKTYKCTTCGEVLKTETIAKKAHTYTNACDTKCNVCSATRTIKHTYKAATCTKAKTCKVCGATSGKALGHKYTNSCDTSCNTCKATRKITHSYKTVTKKATTTANGYTVKRCSVCKKETGKTTIYKANKVTLSKTTYTYNGKAQKPTVTVKDAKGNKIASSNYTVTYASGRKNVGTYKVTIKFKGKYSGTKTLTFKINPVKTTVSKLTAAKKSLKVTIAKKTTQVTGYEVQYATNKNFTSAKTKTLTSYKKNTLTLSGLTAKKTYYVRVRTYKTVNGKKVYSAWSAAKSMKTK